MGLRGGPVSNFLLSPLPSEIDDLLVRTSTSGTRKSPQGPNLESRAAGGQQSPQKFVKNSQIRSASVRGRGTNFAATRRIFSLSVKISWHGRFYRLLLLRQLHGQLGDDSDESQQALSQRDRRPLTWKAVHIWGPLRWTFCSI